MVLSNVCFVCISVATIIVCIFLFKHDNIRIHGANFVPFNFLVLNYVMARDVNKTGKTYKIVLCVLNTILNEIHKRKFINFPFISIYDK